MIKNPQSLFLVVVIATLLVPDTSDAQLFRRRRRVRSSGSLAPPIHAKEPRKGVIRRHSRLNRSEYNYNWAASRSWHTEGAAQMLFPKKIRVKLFLKKEHVTSFDKLRVRANWVYLHKSKTKHTAWLPLKRDGDEVYFDVADLEEGRVLKVIPEFYLKSDQKPAKANAKHPPVENAEGTFVYAGRMHTPYYAVTSSQKNEEFKRRARIVSFSFSQWYADEAYGGRRCGYDCYSFYKTSAGGELKGFRLRSLSRSNVPKLAKAGKRLHGDYLTMPGHYGMALCYDEDTGHFCTIEGNYALNGPYRINIDPYRHGLYTWSSIQTIAEVKKEKEGEG